MDSPEQTSETENLAGNELAKKRRASLVTVVDEMIKPDNAADFREATLGFFSTFGIEPSTDPIRAKWNEDHWKNAYQTFHEINPIVLDMRRDGERGKLVDLQIRGQDKYANIYIQQIKQTGHTKFEITPGACSGSDKLKSENSFFAAFEDDIGIDPNDESRISAKYQKPEEDHMVFYYIDGQGEQIKLD